MRNAERLGVMPAVPSRERVKGDQGKQCRTARAPANRLSHGVVYAGTHGENSFNLLRTAAKV